MRHSQVSSQQIVTTLVMRIVVDRSADYTKPHFDLSFTTISTSKKIFFFRAQAEKGIV